MSATEAIILPRVLDTRKGDDVRRTCRIVNCKMQGIKSPCDNKNDVEMGTVHQTPNGSYMIPPQPYIRPAVQDHLDECKNIFEAYLNQN